MSASINIGTFLQTTDVFFTFLCVQFSILCSDNVVLIVWLGLVSCKKKTFFCWKLSRHLVKIQFCCSERAVTQIIEMLLHIQLSTRLSKYINITNRKGTSRDDAWRELSMQIQANEEFASSTEEPFCLCCSFFSERCLAGRQCSQHCLLAQTVKSLGSRESALMQRSSLRDLSGRLGLCYS